MGLFLTNQDFLNRTSSPFYYCDELPNMTLFKKADINGDSIPKIPFVYIQKNQGIFVVDNGVITDFCFEEGIYSFDDTMPPSCIFGKKKAQNMSHNEIMFNPLPFFKEGRIVYFINFSPLPYVQLYTENPVKYFNGSVSREIKVEGSFSIDLIDPFKLFSKIVRNDNKEHFLTDVFEKKIEEDVEKGMVNTILDYSNHQVPFHILCQNKNDIIQRTIESLIFPNILGIGVCNLEISDISFVDNSPRMMNIDVEVQQPLQQPQSTFIPISIPKPQVDEFEGFNVESISPVDSSTQNIEINQQSESKILSDNSFVLNGLDDEFNGVSRNQTISFSNNNSNTSQTSIGFPFANDNEWLCPSCRNDAVGDTCSFCGHKRVRNNLMQNTQQPTTPITPVVVQTENNQWICTNCGSANASKFCSNCGQPKPQEFKIACCNCGWKPSNPQQPPKFCPECGTKY